MMGIVKWLCTVKRILSAYTCYEWTWFQHTSTLKPERTLIECTSNVPLHCKGNIIEANEF